MPNLVNTILLDELKGSFEGMGSCLVVSFDRLTVAQAHGIRNKFRDAGIQFQVVKNRLAIKAFSELNLDMGEAFQGKCGVVVAEEEGAIAAAKLVREEMERIKKPPLVVTGGVIEGEPITGAAAANIADMPDKDTVRAMLAGAINGVARGIATCVQGAAGGGLARCLQAKIDKEEGA